MERSSLDAPALQVAVVAENMGQFLFLELLLQGQLQHARVCGVGYVVGALSYDLPRCSAGRTRSEGCLARASW
jgi:hypothetical protein